MLGDDDNFKYERATYNHVCVCRRMCCSNDGKTSCGGGRAGRRESQADVRTHLSPVLRVIIIIIIIINDDKYVLYTFII